MYLTGEEVFPGTLEEAQQHFQHGLAIGRLGLALSDTRPARLVLDSTVCGVNPQCKIPERAQLPTARDVLRAYPLRQTTHEISGVSFDVRSAHKQVAVHPHYRGYLCFLFQGTIYYYKNCPFGAVISAHFWSRLGGFFPTVISPYDLFTTRCFLVCGRFVILPRDAGHWTQRSCDCNPWHTHWPSEFLEEVRVGLNYSMDWVVLSFTSRLHLYSRAQAGQASGIAAQIETFNPLLQKIFGTLLGIGTLDYTIVARNEGMASLFLL